ncbi:methyltransferase domain-containing protein [Frischella sp. Ac48]|uniref:Methyltransferase domain-containing protein n=1 Tax=Frischella japonica TaxID=2741544 RepID=A0ABR7QYC0_9GAMM|nr:MULTISPECIES: methyltransferase domain-containing protein [Frischella]MBC9131199.1 methyltransferase domain-containing protein [Frischella japonica]MBX4132179.1 methyltransferase domain-containing protein [Frischella sp. Ac48]
MQPFANKRFDQVVSRYSALHWDDVDKSLRKLHRIIQPNSRLIIKVLVSPDDLVGYKQGALRDTFHVRDYTPDD